MATFKVPAWKIQRIFNDNRYFELVKSGQWTAEISESDIVLRSRPRIPAGSLSQSVIYRDELGRRVARVHQFLKPNGKLGASGKPDPKFLEYDGDLYYSL
jgi:hypothetical protein